MDAATLVLAAAYVAFGAAGVALIRTDLAEHRLPNAIVLPATSIVGTLLVLAAVLSGRVEAAGGAAAGALLLGGFYAVLWAAGRRTGGMGGGDVKLALLVGLFLGWHGWGALAWGAAAAFVLGGAAAIALLAAGRADARTPIAFGPFMLLGACVGPLVC
ncbi:prepilin peptidase [Microbacterium sp. Marseille-Q6965]|uniref:prepilin peptidase n=1 Tax=Microbacterium sp. Marseille-Q6965 TaxID=2965072 RepID=UPI0021B84965|nr:prepilin peptidase [Microbacterium sp. Marseille-Q6965]